MNKTLLLIVFILSLLLLAAFITFNIGPKAKHRQGGAYRLFPSDTAHVFGWAGFLIFAASASYSALKRGFPKNIKKWLLVHFITGVLPIFPVAFHIINKLQAQRPGYFISFFRVPSDVSNSRNWNFRKIEKAKILKG